MKHENSRLPRRGGHGRGWRSVHGVLALLAMFLLGGGNAFARDVAIGVFACQGERAAISDWSPVLDYLAGALPATAERGPRRLD